jgi:hypothetical protein
MKPNWLAVVIAFLLGIGLTYLIIAPPIKSDQSTRSAKSDSIPNCKPFVVQQKTKKDSDTSLAPFLTLDTLEASRYVRFFKEYYGGGTFAFTIMDTDIQQFFYNDNCRGLRIYLGLKDPRDPNSGTIILTGVNGYKGDLYLLRGSKEFAIDQSTPCPDDCPWEQDRYTQTQARSDTSRDMLGRMPSDPLKKPVIPKKEN